MGFFGEGRHMPIRIGVLVLATALAGALFAQEHSYTPADIENGGRLYQGSCAGCHGTAGDGVPGVNLMRGQFRRASSGGQVSAGPMSYSGGKQYIAIAAGSALFVYGVRQ